MPERLVGFFSKGSVFLLVAMLSLSGYADYPHAQSSVVSVDTRHVHPNSDAGSGDIALDLRDINTMLAWGLSPSVGLDSGGSAGIPVVTSLSPAVVPAIDGRQWVTIRGQNFAEGAVVTLRVEGEAYVIPASRTEWVSATEILVYVNVTSEEATWSAQVTNPGFTPSTLLEFAVGFPEITPGTTVDFGVVPPGQTENRDFIVRNRGASPASLSVSVASPFSIMNGPFSSVPTGGQQTVTVRYQPTQASSDEKMVVFALGSRSIGRVVKGRSVVAIASGNGAIEGVVSKQTFGGSATVREAFVRLDLQAGSSQSSVSLVTRTASGGVFVFDGLPAGTYLIRAYPPASDKKWNDPASVTEVVSAGQTTETALLLPYATDPVPQARDIPVVLVRGRGEAGNSADEIAYWQAMSNHLDSLGVQYIWDPNADGSSTINGQNGIDCNVDALALYIQNQVNAYKTAHAGEPPPKINFVAHSMGGLIVRKLLHEDALRGLIPEVQNFIMLSTPNAGTILADYAIGERLWDPSWRSTRDLETFNIRKSFSKSVQLPRDLYGRVFVAGGTSSTGDSDLTKAGRLISLNSPLGDKENDGAVTLLSSRADYIVGDYVARYPIVGGLPFYILPFLGLDSPPIIHLFPDSVLHGVGPQNVAFNHYQIKEENVMCDWVGNILTGGVPKNIVGPAPAPSSARSQSGGGEPPPSTNTPEADVLSDYDVFYLAATQSVTRSVALEVTPKAYLDLSCSSSSAWITLESPTGVMIDRTNAAGINGVTYEYSGDENGGSHRVTLIDPEYGNWQMHIDSIEEVDVSWWLWVASDLTLEVFQPDEVASGADIPVMAYVTDGLTNVAVSSVEVMIVAPSETVTNQTILDDGVDGDQVAGDGFWGAWLTGVTESGRHVMTYKANGPHPSGTGLYYRVRQKGTEVAASGGFVVGVDGYETLDSDDNGFADAIRVDISAHVSSTGSYSLAGTLIVENDDTIELLAVTDFVALTAGVAQVSLLFQARDLPEGVATGPFQLGEIRLSRIEEESLVWLNTYTGDETISAMMYNDFGSNLRLEGTSDFGSVRIGTQKVEQITIHNDGWQRMTVGGLLFPAGFSGDFSGDIEPDEEVIVPVTFTPVTESVYTGLLAVTSDAAVGDDDIPLLGLGLPVGISFGSWVTNANLPPELAALTNVANADGIPNYLAYLHNINPTNGLNAGETNALPYWRLYLTNETIAVDYRINPHAVGFTLDIESATNLLPGSSWQLVMPDEFQSLDPDPLTGDWRYRATMNLGNTTGGFMRLNVTIEE